MLQIVEDVEAEAVALRRWWAERHVDGVLLVDLRVEDPEGASSGAAPPPGRDRRGTGSDGHGALFPRQRHLRHTPDRRPPGGSGAYPHRPGGRAPTPSPAPGSATRCSRRHWRTAGASGRVLPTDYTSSAGADATRKLLAAKRRPTAIIYDNDIMAVAGLGVAQEMGIVVPNELSVVSFDDSILCEVVRPSLTACARDVEAYGARAACALLDLLEGRPVPPARGGAHRTGPSGPARPPPPPSERCPHHGLVLTLHGRVCGSSPLAGQRRWSAAFLRKNEPCDLTPPAAVLSVLAVRS